MWESRRRSAQSAPNGAGKSSTLRALFGLVASSSDRMMGKALTFVVSQRRNGFAPACHWSRKPERSFRP